MHPAGRETVLALRDETRGGSLKRFHLTAGKLLELAKRHLPAGDVDEFAAALRHDWSARRLIELVSSGSPHVAHVASVGLGLIGGMTAVPALAEVLRLQNLDAVRAAESALWSIWFRAAGPAPQTELFNAMALIAENQTADGIAQITDLIRQYPRYAEAFDQRAAANYLCDRPERARGDYRQAIHLNPHHFAARAGEGSCEAAMGRFREALNCYATALSIHPRMEGVRQTMRRLREFTPTRSGAQPSAAFLSLVMPDSGSIVLR